MLGPFGFHPNKTMRSRAMGFARVLVSRGHAVKMIMPPWQTPEEQDKEWSEDGVELEYVSLNGGIVPTVGRMVRAARMFEPDVIWGFKPKAYSGLAMFWLWQTRWASKQPILATDTDDWEGWGGWNDIADYSTVQKYFFAWQERWGMRRNHLLTYASQALGERANQMGISNDQMLYLPNGPGIEVAKVDPNDVKSLRQQLGTENRPTLLLYSRLFEFDTERLIGVLKQVRADVRDLAILSIGAGLFESQAEDLRDQLAEAQLLDAFIDVGWLQEHELPLYLKSADVGLYLMDDTLLNRTKCPVKLADMVAMGLPVVAESGGEVKLYVVHQKNGLLFESGEVNRLAGGLRTCLTSRFVSDDLGQGGLERHRSVFAWETTVTWLEHKLEAIRAAA